MGLSILKRSTTWSFLKDEDSLCTILLEFRYEYVSLIVICEIEHSFDKKD